ncbi:MAG TPA: hypothetical protein VKZ84_06215 [Bacteriovoracaceae bacterium]|nr:hypothetical protein [Bacteriovoracaceae bacterium]
MWIRLILSIFVIHSSFIWASDLTSLKLKNPNLIPTIHNYENICEEAGILPTVDSLNSMCEIVVKNEMCSKVPQDDLLDCNSLDNSFLTNQWDFITGCAKGVFNSVKDTLNFFWEIMKFTWENATSSEVRAKTADASSEFLHSTKLYLHTEYQKAYAKASPPMKQMKALSSMGGAIGSLVVNKISEFVAAEYEEFGCLNQKAKSSMLCGIVGDIFIPPAGVVALLKYGKVAVKEYPKLSRIFDLSKKTGYAKTLSMYPKLRKSYEELGKEIPTAKSISHPREINFKASDNFRPIKAEEMKRRADQLDPTMGEAITAAYNSLNDPEELTKYFKELHQETVERMIAKGRPEDLALLKEGKISKQAMNVVLVKRLKDRGDNQFTTIVLDPKGLTLKYKGDSLDGETLVSAPDKFRAAVKSGPFFDRAFDDADRYGHGAFTHIMQRDIVSKSVAKATNNNPQEFWGFLGSKKGINWWADLFDSGNSDSFNRPETLRKFIGHNLNAD